jgi:hypothetical protein
LIIVWTSIFLCRFNDPDPTATLADEHLSCWLICEWYLAHREVGERASKVELVAGGTTEGRARANEHSWSRVLSFVQAAIAARTGA